MFVIGCNLFFFFIGFKLGEFIIEGNIFIYFEFDLFLVVNVVVVGVEFVIVDFVENV